MNSDKILIVDDMSNHLLLLQTILEEEGYKTIVLDQPTKVIETMEQKDVGIVLLDIMMPKMDGFMILDEIAGKENLNKIPVIIISAKTDSWSIKNAMDKGAFDYITKPINIQDLKNKIKSAFNALGGPVIS